MCAYINRQTYVKVGSEIRHACMGAPMGEPGSCAQANGVCLHAEQTYHVERERAFGDSARIASSGFVDDLHTRFG